MDNKVKMAFLNKDEFDRLLGRTPLTQFVEEMSSNGYRISYQNFYGFYTGKSQNWSLTLAFAVSESLGKPIEQLFCIKEV